MLFDGGGGSFINKGTNGRWKDVLSADEIAKADLIAAKNLTPDCAHWLRTGELCALMVALMVEREGLELGRGVSPVNKLLKSLVL